MCLYVDKKFINIVSSQLDKFVWKKPTLANCRCPICGDSTTNKNKCRGYFFANKNNYFYKCHNCGYSSNVYNFLNQVAPTVAKEYSLETFSSRNEKKKDDVIVPKQDDKMFIFDRKPKPKDDSQYLKNCIRVDKLDSDHFCRQFLDLRKIPKDAYKLLYFTENFGKFLKRMDPESTMQCGWEPRLVIPFFNQDGDVVAAQGRALNMKDEENARSTAKYLTVKTDKSADRLWYGQWRVNPKKRIYIVEGPLDSLFISNTIAMVGAGALDQIPPHLSKSDGVYVLDNEPRNAQIVRYNERLIELGKNVCIWPDYIKQKDINDLITSGFSSSQIKNIIDDNTVTGLEANLRLTHWRKV
jgi:predicted RNA-binding Zn-ribbon protein involved in translation (DUF1610 family)